MKNKFSKVKPKEFGVCVKNSAMALPLGDPDPRSLQRKKSIKTIKNDYQI